MNMEDHNDYVDFEEAKPDDKKRKTIIIVAVVAVVLCCCCVAAIGGYWAWNNGDQYFTSLPLINIFA